jgi:hypothetical protein
VVLEHVLERADSVVIAGPALQRERLLPDDVHLCDVRAVPYRFKGAIREPGAEDVLHRCHRQEVIDAEHGPSGISPASSVFSSVASARSSPNGFSSTIELPGGRPARCRPETVAAKVEEAVTIDEDARRRALQASFLIVAGISLLSIFPAGRLPKDVPSESSAEDIVSEAK